MHESKKVFYPCITYKSNLNQTKEKGDTSILFTIMFYLVKTDKVKDKEKKKRKEGKQFFSNQ